MAGRAIDGVVRPTGIQRTNNAGTQDDPVVFWDDDEAQGAGSPHPGPWCDSKHPFDDEDDEYDPDEDLDDDFDEFDEDLDDDFDEDEDEDYDEDFDEDIEPDEAF